MPKNETVESLGKQLVDLNKKYYDTDYKSYSHPATAYKDMHQEVGVFWIEQQEQWAKFYYIFFINW